LSEDTVSASEVAEYEYCSLKKYCDEMDIDPDESLKKKKQERMKKGTKQHERVGKKIRYNEKIKEVSYLLVLGALAALLFLGLLLWFL